MAKRDWDADWAMCKAATPGPWEIEKKEVAFEDGKDLQVVRIGPLSVEAMSLDDPHIYIDCWLEAEEPDLQFAAEARSALPHWLARVKKQEEALRLAYRALTEGMADVPSGKRYRPCSQLRAEAKQKIREVLGIGD